MDGWKYLSAREKHHIAVRIALVLFYGALFVVLVLVVIYALVNHG